VEGLALTSEPLPDAAHARNELLREKLVRPLPIAVPIACVPLAVIGGGTVGGGAAVAGVAFAVFAYFAWRSASAEAADRFYASYAQSRGLELADADALPEGPPLLRAGDRRHASRVMTGELEQGLHGALAHFVFEQWAGEGENQRVTPNLFTVVVYRMPESPRARELRCEPRVRRDTGTGAAGLPGMRPLRQESVEAERRYAIAFGEDDDEVWVRRLFSPTFLVWLAESSPEQFGFQLSQGWLCGFVPGHVATAAGFDALIAAATTVGHRILGEVNE
jgi:hypothetical protein